MAFIKVVYGSTYNVSVRGTDYFEIDDELLDGNGELPERIVDEVWQEAVNEFMSDTSADVVENEGD